MANDRIYLRCKVCGGAQMLFKYYPVNGYLADADRLDAFITDHLLDCRGAPGSLEGDPGFTLETETDVVG